MTFEEAVISKFRGLPFDKQQEVFDFIEFLSQRLQSTSRPQEVKADEDISVFEAASDLLGCVEGPTDLSTNESYLEGYGS